MDFGMKLQSLRKEKGLSQEALQSVSGNQVQGIQKWINSF